jgi:hypothetical protein
MAANVPAPLTRRISLRGSRSEVEKAGEMERLLLGDSLPMLARSELKDVRLAELVSLWVFWWMTGLELLDFPMMMLGGADGDGGIVEVLGVDRNTPNVILV